MVGKGNYKSFDYVILISVYFSLIYFLFLVFSFHSQSLGWVVIDSSCSN